MDGRLYGRRLSEISWPRLVCQRFDLFIKIIDNDIGSRELFLQKQNIFLIGSAVRWLVAGKRQLVERGAQAIVDGPVVGYEYLTAPLRVDRMDCHAGGLNRWFDRLVNGIDVGVLDDRCL